MQHRLPSTMASISEIGRPMATKARKTAPTGGNRSWSEEEETYLLQTRLQKMPYKHIAAHLNKTELACRLHYHQLSHGSHRRKRTSSTSSSSSTASSTGSGSSRHSPQHQYQLPCGPALLHDDYSTPHANHLLPPFIPGSSPPSHLPYPPHGPTPHRHPHKLLLPKPRPLTPDASPPRSFHHPTTGLRISTNPYHLSIGSLAPTPEAPPQPNTGPHLPPVNGASASAPAKSPVDTDRLRAIYDQHRTGFWGAIAAEYGADVDPAKLEDTWRQGPARRAERTRHDPPPPAQAKQAYPHDASFWPPSYERTYAYPPPPSQAGIYGSPERGVHPPTPEDSPHPGGAAQAVRADHEPFPAFEGGRELGQGVYGRDTLPRLVRGWSASPGPSGGSRPATAITALLTEDKCPRHDGYCIGGRCR
ncbi:hypothetical protein EJ06DRAFT_568417 [Trichodelitschia bisporula]|uniref:Myb-like domain-containing protein n=1 Tax=Trichodelitschia bisporula TaxID=703511 RepID=A0A6G1I8P6_9PEZI|nr:hypothetical protein EJ06DRAFT_568417 [Trichodelitschia bisporula]